MVVSHRKGLIFLISDIIYDVLITIIVAGLGAIYRLIKNGLSSNSKEPTEGTYSPKLIKAQFWWSLLVYSLSLGFIFSLSWDFSFGWQSFLKILAMLLALLSFLLLWGAFDAAFAHKPNDKIKNTVPDCKADQGSKK